MAAVTVLDGEVQVTFRGQTVDTRTEAPPPLDAEAQAAFLAKAKALAPDYKTELLPPPGAD